MKYSYRCEIYCVRLCDELKMMLLKHHDLFKWQFPDLPEDLCFIRKKDNNCWMKIVAHEKECMIFDENQSDLELLKKCGVKYFKGTGIFKIETPTISFFKE